MFCAGEPNGHISGVGPHLPPIGGEVEIVDRGDELQPRRIYSLMIDRFCSMGDIVHAERYIQQMFSELSFGDIFRNEVCRSKPPSFLLNRFLLGFGQRLPRAEEMRELFSYFEENNLGSDRSRLLRDLIFMNWRKVGAIPTQETVSYIVEQIDYIQNLLGRRIRVLEVGGGSGGAGLAILSEIESLRVNAEFIMTEPHESAQVVRQIRLGAAQAVLRFVPDVILCVFPLPGRGENISDIEALRVLQREYGGYLIVYHNGDTRFPDIPSFSGSQQFLERVAHSPHSIRLLTRFEELTDATARKVLFTLGDASQLMQNNEGSPVIEVYEVAKAWYIEATTEGVIELIQHNSPTEGFTNIFKARDFLIRRGFRILEYTHESRVISLRFCNSRIVLGEQGISADAENLHIQFPSRLTQDGFVEYEGYPPEHGRIILETPKRTRLARLFNIFNGAVKFIKRLSGFIFKKKNLVLESLTTSETPSVPQPETVSPPSSPPEPSPAPPIPVPEPVPTPSSEPVPTPPETPPVPPTPVPEPVPPRPPEPVPTPPPEPVTAPPPEPVPLPTPPPERAPATFSVSNTNINLNPPMTPAGFLGGTVIGAILLMSGPLMIKGYEEYILPHISNRTRANGLEQFVLGNIPLAAYMGGSMLITGSGFLAEAFGAGFGMIAAYPIVEGVDISAEMIGLDTSINSPGSFVTTRVLGAALMYASSYVPIGGASAAGLSHAAVFALRAGMYRLFAGRAAGALWRGGLTGLAVAAAAISGTIAGRNLDHMLVGDFGYGGLDETDIIINRMEEDGFSFAAFNEGVREMGRRVTEEDSDGVHTFSDWYANWAYDCIHGLEHSSYAEHRGV